MLADATLLKDVLVALSFASGLIPSVALANKQATSSLLDAVSSTAPTTTDSPPLRLSPLLFYPTPPRVADVLAVVSRIDAKALKDHLKPFVEQGHINKWAIPSQIAVVTEIPKTSVGKLDKKRIRQDIVQWQASNSAFLSTL